MSGVLHIATDSSIGKDPNVVITGTVTATVTLMRSAAKTPSVKSFVLTASRICAYNQESSKTYAPGPDTFFDEIVPLAWGIPAEHEMKPMLVCKSSYLLIVYEKY